MRQVNINNARLCELAGDPRWRNSLKIVRYEEMFTDTNIATGLFDWLDIEVTSDLESRIRDFVAHSASRIAIERSISPAARTWIEENLDQELFSAVERLI